MENNLPQKTEHIHGFEDAYVSTRYLGRVKIKAVKYTYNQTKEMKVIALDASCFIKAILKDALSGEIKFFDKNGYIK